MFNPTHLGFRVVMSLFGGLIFFKLMNIPNSRFFCGVIKFFRADFLGSGLCANPANICIFSGPVCDWDPAEQAVPAAAGHPARQDDSQDRWHPLPRRHVNYHQLEIYIYHNYKHPIFSQFVLICWENCDVYVYFWKL